MIVRLVAAGLLLCLGACAGEHATRSSHPMALPFETFAAVGEARWENDDGTWRAVRDSGAGFLVSRERYRDVELSVEFFAEADTNSGVFARCDDPAEITPTACYEFNIWDNHPDQTWRTGALVTVESSLARLTTDGRWNRYRVRILGSRIEAWVNGTKTVDLEHEALRSGHLALQYGGSGMVRFRGFEVRRL